MAFEEKRIRGFHVSSSSLAAANVTQQQATTFVKLSMPFFSTDNIAFAITVSFFSFILQFF